MEKLPNLWERLLGRAQETDQSQWKIIALCVLGATTFWFFSALNKQDYNSTINYPIRFEYGNVDSLVVVEDLPANIRMNVTGGGWNLLRRSLGLGIKPLSIPLANPTDTPYLLGSSLVSQINDQVKLFNLNQVVTDTLHIRIEPLAERSVQLGLDPGSIKLAEDHVLVGPVKIEPLEVQVKGNASFIDSLGDTLWLSLQEETINDNFDRDLPLPGESSVIEWSVNRVSVSFPVDPLVERNTQANLITRNFPPNVRLKDEMDWVEVSYKVPSSLADSIKSFEVIADFTNMSTDSSVRLTYPQPPHIVDVQLEVLSLKVTYE